MFAIVAAALVAVPVVLRAEDKPAKAAKPASAAAEAGKNNRSLPFNGKVSAVDSAAKTVTVGSQTLNVTAETKITKDGKPATLADITVGEAARGSYKKDEAGKLNAASISVGEKAPKGEQPKKKKAEK